MDNELFSISLQGSDGMRIWELDDIPQPNMITGGTALYLGQKRVEHLLKALNSKASSGEPERYLDQFYDIFKRSLEQGVREECIVLWDDRSFYIRTSWTGYAWKLPPDIKRRSVQINISKADAEGTIRTQMRKVAEDGSIILIPPKMASKMNLRKGNAVTVRIRFCV